MLRALKWALNVDFSRHAKNFEHYVWHPSWRQVYALGLVGWRPLGKENEYFTKLDLLAFDTMCIMNTRWLWATFKTKGTACMRCIQHYLWVIARVTENRRLETICNVRTQTNATKTYLHEGRMLRHYSSMVSLTASGRHDKRMSPTNLQPPTAPSIGSGGNKLSLRCWRCSPSRHATGIQKQNLTDQEKGVVSSLSVCERPDFFKTRWWTKKIFW